MGILSVLVYKRFNLVSEISKLNIVLRHLSEMSCNFDVNFPNRAKMTFSSGQLAKFADGSALAQLGDTSVLVTAVSKLKPSTSSFLPLTVDYRQKAAAAGRIPTNFLRKELGPMEHEILVSRLIDRSLRPLFPHNYFYETQIVCNLLAVDGVYDPEILCINAASTALSLSDIPWDGPVGAVRIGLIDDKFIINPMRRELNNSSLNLVVTATEHNLVVMLEAAADNILQQDFLKAIKTAVKECQRIIQVISQMQKKLGKPKRVIEFNEVPKELLYCVKSLSEMRLREIFQDYSHDKLSRDDAVKQVRVSVIENLKQEVGDKVNADQASEAFNIVCKEIFRTLILENEIRCDGRTLQDIRCISSQVDLYKPLHGSSIFQRGQTQVLCTVSLDSVNSVLHSDPISMLTSGVKEKNFFLHYEFPPYAVKEIGKIGPAVRREIGHGALAERALRPVVPNNFPFTIRLTSEVMESNGSSSMASVCGGSLALFDAGVPLTSPAAGVAIGLVSKYENSDTKHMSSYKILTDILGIEDYMGDMDFKIAGSKKGITALQADIKIPGLPLKVIMEAVQAGCVAKAKIIDLMNESINKPRSERKQSWPVTDVLDIPVNKRGVLIGPGGINLHRIMATTGAQITFQEDKGTYHIFAPNQISMDEAKEQISKLLSSSNAPTLEFGGIYSAKIVEMRESGVMVTLYDSMRPALLHNSQLDQRKINDPRALGFEVGQEIQVKYFGLDPVSGQMRLSRKVLMSSPPTVIVNLQKL